MRDQYWAAAHMATTTEQLFAIGSTVAESYPLIKEARRADLIVVTVSDWEGII